MTDNLPTKFESNEVEVRHTEALETIGRSLNSLCTFVTSGGLSSLLSGYARSQAVKEILGGLAAHDGRNALDARVLNQNALEIVTQVEAVFKKYQENLSSKEVRDSDIHDGEAQFKKWEGK